MYVCDDDTAERMSDYDSEDDKPLVFRRNNAALKQNQLNPELTKSLSQKQDAISGRQGSDVSPNGQHSSQVDKTVSLSEGLPFASQKASSSSAEAEPRKPPVTNIKAPISAVDLSNNIIQNAPYSHGENIERRRMETNPSCPSPCTSPKPRICKDPEDVMVLSMKFPPKLNAGTSTGKSSDSDESKHLASELKKEPLSSLNKRPLIQTKNSDLSSSKKAKLSEASASTNRKRKKPKAEEAHDDDDNVLPISQRTKMSATPVCKVSDKKKITDVSASLDKVNKKSKKVIKETKFSKSLRVPPGSGEGQKWTTLVHNGVIFPPLYMPNGVKILYKGNPVDLTPEQEEVATMFAVMLDTEYMTKPKFKENFMSDWKKILGNKHIIQNLEDCDFTPIYEWHQREKEKKQMSTDEKKARKEEKMKQEEKYMWAIVDGVKEKVGNFRVEPPGLFRGRGEHPKMGKLKKRIFPKDITINIGKDAPIPEPPISGERWKEIRHDNTVTWLAFWNDPINPKEFKYVFLAASSSLKGQSDKEKYEKARKLKEYIEGIRATYTKNFASKDSKKRQIAVATYLIDKLALRAGNEKDDDEADTVGCCTLKVENVETKPPSILKFDFLGKDSIRYQNEVEIEPPVFSAIEQFRSGKEGGDDLFDQLDTNKLEGYSIWYHSKVFRTYNASITLDEMLSRVTKGGDVAAKVVVYQHANKEVAIICNHQRTVSKSHSAQMLRLNEKINELKGLLEELEEDLTRVNKGKPPLKNSDGKPKRNLNPEALQRKIAQTNTKIEKMERDKETKEDLKTVALGTSKINYLDPRITVAWCKRHDIPIEKIFNKSLPAKFAWAMDVDPKFRF
ncbi:DNA topoisomerase I [Heracleum sosnowskyi]|uniref:DNA topoisomerase I n=1 Tax=Heracleum sosnowskyi TaxID=360622 RepID=A0AAD8H9E0_9APIA|nr:DNA topoisomerase I [Heracleum sosnowskyi]